MIEDADFVLVKQEATATDVRLFRQFLNKELSASQLIRETGAGLLIRGETDWHLFDIDNLDELVAIEEAIERAD
jgi:hypothetical protein